jgi:hypothetical protein
MTPHARPSRLLHSAALRVAMLALALAAAPATPAAAAPATRPATRPATKPVVMPLNARVPADFIDHTSSDGTLSIKAPPDWSPRANVHELLILTLTADDARGSLNVELAPRSPSREPVGFAAAARDGLIGKFDDVVVRRTTYVRIAGIDCPRIEFDRTNANGKHVRFHQVIVPTEAHTYIITFFALVETFDAVVRVFDQMLASLTVDGVGLARRSVAAAPPTAYALSTYVDSTANLRIKYPAGWTEQTRLDPAGARFTPLTAERGKMFREELLVAAWPDDRTTLDFETSQLLATTKKAFPDARVLRKARATLAVQPATEFVFTATQGGVAVQVAQRVMVADDRLYVVTFRTTAATAAAQQPMIEEIFGSFRTKPGVVGALQIVSPEEPPAGTPMTYGGKDATAKKPNLTEYIGASGRVRISFPSTWTTEVQRDAPQVTFWADGFSGDLRPYLALARMPAAGNTAEELADAVWEGTRRNGPQVRLVRRGPATLAGQPAVELIYTGPIGPLTAQVVNRCVVIDDAFYTVSFTTMPADYAGQEPLIKAMFDSLQVGKIRGEPAPAPGAAPKPR